LAITVRTATGKADQETCLRLRFVVFVDEQNVPMEEEIDDLDDVSTHFLAFDGEERADSCVGTARLYISPEGKAKAQRVAVLKEARGTGVGRALMDALEAAARELGHDEVVLGAQVSAIPFYERLGYVADDEVFMDAGIPHKMMAKAL
jgi:predicted GNAT family N-acyltransferase